VQNRTDHIIAALAEDQHGVVSRAQLLSAGVSAKVIEVRVRRESLISLHRGVYAVGHRQLRREGYWLAAVLAVGRGAALSHRQAAGLHGFRPSNGSTIDVTTKRDRGGLAGIWVHRTRALEDEDVTEIDGIPVTTASRTLVDLAGMVAEDHLARALREADRLQILDVRGIERVLARTAHRTGKGHQRMREALARYATIAHADTRSTLEDDFLRLVHRADLPPPQTNVPLCGLKVDALWANERVVVELDGLAYHLNRHSFQEDRERDRKLTLAGYRVLRYTWKDLTRDARRTISELRGLLAP
jgi:very-short-patch-repair endonuclease